jgi:VWFA-related protein
MRWSGLSVLTIPTQTRTGAVCSRLGFLIVWSLCAVLASCWSVVEGRPISPQADNGIHIDLPANGQLRVENQFGDIDVSVWKERDVLVTVEGDGAARAARSPVMIETRQNFLSIKVVGTRSGATNPISISLKIPERTRVEIVTDAGQIVSHGQSASLTLNTISGRILAELESPLDTDVIAQSTLGSVRSEVDAAGSDQHTYRSRFGQGQKLLRVNSRRGDIVLSASAVTAPESAADAKPPELKGSSGSSGAGTPASQSASEEVDEGDVIRVDAQLVALNLSVIDRGTNKGITGLTQANFKLFENGVEQKLLQFDSSSAPFDLVLLIDLSGSTRDVVKLIRAAARRFVDAARPSDRIAIITFAGQASVVSPLTLDRELLRQRVDAIDTIAGDTKLYDAGDFAMAEVVKETKNSRRAAIVLMSDGLDGSIPGVQGDGSKLDYKEFLNNVREFDGVLYTLWLNTYYEALNDQDTQPEAFDMGYDRMKEVADAGGGMFYEVESLDDLAGAYERVVADIGTVYSMAYRPADKTRDGKWRSIKVTVDRSNAVARGKHGYYAK